MKVRKRRAAKRKSARAAKRKSTGDTVGLMFKGGEPKEVAGAIMQILSAPHADETTKQRALDALERATSISNVSLTGCHFGMSGGEST